MVLFAFARDPSIEILFLVLSQGISLGKDLGVCMGLGANELYTPAIPSKVIGNLSYKYLFYNAYSTSCKQLENKMHL